MAWTIKNQPGCICMYIFCGSTLIPHFLSLFIGCAKVLLLAFRLKCKMTSSVLKITPSDRFRGVFFVIVVVRNIDSCLCVVHYVFIRYQFAKKNTPSHVHVIDRVRSIDAHTHGKWTDVNFLCAQYIALVLYTNHVHVYCNVSTMIGTAVISFFSNRLHKVV